MQLERAREQEELRQAHRMQALLGFKEKWIDATVAAQVIGTSGMETSRLLYLDKGAKDGIRPDMPVITPDGLVGKVLNVYGDTSQVLMINDLTSGVGAILVKSRLQGIVKGTPTGEVQLNYIMSDESVQPGEAAGHQRRRPGLSQGVADRHGEQGERGAQPVPRYQGETGGGFGSSGRGAGHHRAEAARAGRERPGGDSRLRHSCRAPARRACATARRRAATGLAGRACGAASRAPRDRRSSEAEACRADTRNCVPRRRTPRSPSPPPAKGRIRNESHASQLYLARAGGGVSLLLADLGGLAPADGGLAGLHAGEAAISSGSSILVYC